METILEQLRKEFNFSPDEKILCSTALKIIERVFADIGQLNLTPQDEQSLKHEIQHIFESGANEIRILEMVKSFIEKREQALYIHDVSNSVCVQTGFPCGAPCYHKCHLYD